MKPDPNVTPVSVKTALLQHPINELISGRWSPYGFAKRPVAEADLRSIFEAARWAPSSYNEQPWSYLVATSGTPVEFDRMLSCLVPQNQAWAQAAPVLAIGVVSMRFAKTGKDNKAAIHDLGLASGNLVLEATARGLSVHQMIGILPERARELYSIPEHAEAWTAMAIGYRADFSNLPSELRERDAMPRQRKPLSQFVFTGTWGQEAALEPEETSVAAD